MSTYGGWWRVITKYTFVRIRRDIHNMLLELRNTLNTDSLDDTIRFLIQFYKKFHKMGFGEFLKLYECSEHPVPESETVMVCCDTEKGLACYGFKKESLEWLHRRLSKYG